MRNRRSEEKNQLIACAAETDVPHVQLCDMTARESEREGAHWLLIAHGKELGQMRATPLRK